MKTIFALLLSGVLTIAIAAERGDLTLNDGTVLKNARIVAVGKDTVSIVHSGGSTSVARSCRHLPPSKD